MIVDFVYKIRELQRQNFTIEIASRQKMSERENE